MLKKFLQLFRGGSIEITGTRKLPEGEARLVTIGDPLAGSGLEVVLCRVEGQLYALDANCPHEDGRIEGGPLADGKYAVCPLHNYQFDPKNGKVVNAVCSKAKTYAVVEGEDGCTLKL